MIPIRQIVAVHTCLLVPPAQRNARAGAIVRAM